ncbi:MAG: hypothetical protein ACKOAU_07025, partial [Pirellula sp.]
MRSVLNWLRTSGLAAAVLVGVISKTAFAGVVLPPPSLNPGDKYYLAFVTDGGRLGDSGAISDYDTFVTNQASLNTSLNGFTWNALVSVAAAGTLGAKDRLNLGAFPIFRLDGVRLASSWADLWDGTIENTFSVNQFGNSVTRDVFTGTLGNGAKSGSALGDETVTFGNTSSTSSAWVANGSQDNLYSLSIYAISSLQTLPGGGGGGGAVPEPTSMAIFGL